MDDDDRFFQIFGEIWGRLNQLEENQMATQAEVDTITTEVQTVATDLTTAQTALQAEIDSLAAANPSIDLSGLRTAVAPLAGAVTALGNLQPLTAAPAAPTDSGTAAAPAG
jgi:multidrug resistance efflux pump